MKRLILLCVVALLCACGAGASRPTVEATADNDCVEVLYFHTKKRCVTCNAIEHLAKEVVDSIGSDRVVMRVVDITQDETLAAKYEVTWSALILDRGGRSENLTQMGFSYAKNQPAVFKARLTEAINRMME